VAGIASEVIVKPSVARHMSRNKKLLSGWKMRAALARGVGIGPRPRGELED
jgi:hypothetical protein